MNEDLVKRLRTICPEDYGHPMDFAYGAQQAMHEAADAIEELQRRLEQALYMPLPAWIPVTERLPEKEGNVLVYLDEGVYVVNFSPKNQQFNNFDNLPYKERNVFGGVTHWMPLPQPPKEET